MKFLKKFIIKKSNLTSQKVYNFKNKKKRGKNDQKKQS